ncbi:MAG: hypothetical protein HYX62_00370 [Gammaproteobacteria bacterium]|nr:hypothetical protein [Gammaproteobacteria bacterium]
MLATDTNRLKIEETARASVLAQQRATDAAGVNTFRLAAGLSIGGASTIEPIPEATRFKALSYVDERLIKEGLLDKTGKLSDEIKKRFSYERRSSLPTPGLLVKGCLDDCNICESAVEKEVELGLERAALENELLKKKIELLEKSQEYRCCPVLPEPTA